MAMARSLDNRFGLFRVVFNHGLSDFKLMQKDNPKQQNIHVVFTYKTMYSCFP